jgi:hypothetical protein
MEGEAAVLYVVLSIDVEHDMPLALADQVALLRSRKPDFTYRSLSAVVKLLARMHRGGARWNWMVRADNLIEEAHGHPAFMFEAFKEEWNRILKSGDEVGFHPHPYRLVNGSWVQEKDVDRQVAVLRDGCESVSRLGFRLRSVRTGWDMMTSPMMETLDRLGFTVELSALPGLAREDSVAGYSYDWRSAPSLPYHPSRTNYQQPGDLSILEIPQTVNRVKRFGGRVFVSAFNPCGRTSLYEPCVIQAVERASKNDVAFLAGYTHLEDFIYSRGRISAITGQTGLDHFEKLLSYLTRLAGKRAVRVSFLTASQARDVAEQQ